MDKCKSCKKPIKWINTESGKKMPVDDQEICILVDAKGEKTVVLLDGSVVRGTMVMFGTPGAKRGYISHFASCTEANQWRRK